MTIKNLVKIVIVSTALLVSAGCGSNSNTNGTLTLTPLVTPAAGFAVLQATVVVSPGRTGSTLSGIPVNITAVQSGRDATGALVTDPAVSSGTLKTDTTGKVVWTQSFPQKTYKTTILITASSDSLAQTGIAEVAAL
jgi:hypothetical protein